MLDIILADAIRRQVLKGDFKTKTNLILATPSYVKKSIEKGYVQPKTNEAPRVHGWYSLTEKGLRACVILREMNKDEFGNDEALYWFNYS